MMGFNEFVVQTEESGQVLAPPSLRRLVYSSICSGNTYA